MQRNKFPVGVSCHSKLPSNTAPEVLHKSKLRIILVKFHIRVSFKIPDSCENISVGDTHTHKKTLKKKSQNIHFLNFKKCTRPNLLQNLKFAKQQTNKLKVGLS